MKKFTLAVAFACTAGLLAGCGGGSDDDAGTAPEATEEGSVLTQPIKKAENLAAELGKKADEADAAMGAAARGNAAMGDAAAAATESRTVTLAIEGMS